MLIHGYFLISRKIISTLSNVAIRTSGLQMTRCTRLITNHEHRSWALDSVTSGWVLKKVLTPDNENMSFLLSVALKDSVLVEWRSLIQSTNHNNQTAMNGIVPEDPHTTKTLREEL